MNERDDLIQLVIKAPNQNVDDYVINCNSDWTVGELKEYLSEEYPNKPDVLEQRLIYSGRLLHNHLHLRDILRHDEDEPTVHTLHLVCNANSHSFKSQRPTSSQNWYNQATTSSHSNNPAIPGSASESTLRHRNASFVPLTNSDYSQLQPPTAVTLTGDAQVMAQMAAMQQMYAHYMNQYMQSMNTAANSPVFPEPPTFQPNRNNNEVQQQVNQRLNAQGGQEENDEIANRDWLDHLFLCCRFLIFFCIVYFYSTPERLMIVIVCAVIAFLYHEGWFVRRARPVPVVAELYEPQININNVRAPPNEVNNENVPLLVNQDLRANEENQDEIEAAMDGEDPPHARNTERVNQIFSPLNMVSTFFSSLIPEPPPPVNIN